MVTTPPVSLRCGQMIDVDLPPGWCSITKVYGSEFKLAGKTYTHYGQESGKRSSIKSVKKVYELYSQANGLDFDTEWEKYIKNKEDKAELASERNGRFSPSRRAALLAKFVDVCGTLQGADVVEFRGWKTRVAQLPGGQWNIMYTDPCGRNFLLLATLQAWLGFCMENGFEDRVRELVETAQATADHSGYTESKKLAAEQEDNVYSFVKNPLRDGESGFIFESDEQRRDDTDGSSSATPYPPKLGMAVEASWSSRQM